MFLCDVYSIIRFGICRSWAVWSVGRQHLCIAHGRRFPSDSGPRGTGGKQIDRRRFRTRGCARAAGRCPAVSCRGNAPLASPSYAAPPTSHTRVSLRAWPSPASLTDPTEHRRASRATRNLPLILVRVSSSMGLMAGDRGHDTDPGHRCTLLLVSLTLYENITIRSCCGYLLYGLTEEVKADAIQAPSHVVD